MNAAAWCCVCCVVLCRDMVFLVRQYPPPASFFTVQIQILAQPGEAAEEDWCSFFPVTAVRQSAVSESVVCQSVSQ